MDVFQKDQITERDHVAQLWEDKEESKLIEDGEQVLLMIWMNSVNDFLSLNHILLLLTYNINQTIINLYF